jgi:hypothetical protein
MSIANIFKANSLNCELAQTNGYMKRMIDRLFGADACIGKWGALYPRQMRDIGLRPIVASAKTSYRAAHLAQTVVHSFPYSVDDNGELQEAYPVVSRCFAPGTNPLPYGTRSTSDNYYGWVYWRPVSCCIPFSIVQNCLKN